MVKAPVSAVCPPTRNGSTWRMTPGSFVASISRSICPRITSRPPIGRRNAASSTTAHRRGGSPPGRIFLRGICRLTLRSRFSRGGGGVARGSVPARENLLACYSQADPLLDFFRRRGGVAQGDHRAGVVLGLQEPGDELQLIGPDQRRRLFETDVGLEPARQDVTVPVPPART